MYDTKLSNFKDKIYRFSQVDLMKFSLNLHDEIEGLGSKNK